MRIIECYFWFIPLSKLFLSIFVMMSLSKYNTIFQKRPHILMWTKFCDCSDYNVCIFSLKLLQVTFSMCLHLMACLLDDSISTLANMLSHGIIFCILFSAEILLFVTFFNCWRMTFVKKCLGCRPLSCVQSLTCTIICNIVASLITRCNQAKLSCYNYCSNRVHFPVAPVTSN